MSSCSRVINEFQKFVRYKFLEIIFKIELSLIMPNDLREYTKQTNVRLVIWFLVILFVVGLGLIWAIYGASSALLGFLCLIGFSIPIGLIVIFLVGLDKIVNKQN